MSEQKLAAVRSQDANLDAARVAALFSVARPAYYATLANAGLLVLVLWDAFPAALLLGWFGVLVAVTLARVGLQRAYARHAEQKPSRRWESLFTLGAVVAGALWTYPLAVFLPVSDPLLQMAVIFVVGGNIIGATGVYAPSPAVFYGFCTLPFLTIVAVLAMQPGRSYGLTVLPAVVLFSAGLALTVAPLTATVLAAADASRAGVASGVNNAVARIGGLLAVASIPLVAGFSPVTDVTPGELVDGFHTTLIAAAVLVAIGAVLSFLGIRSNVLQGGMPDNPTAVENVGRTATAAPTPRH